MKIYTKTGDLGSTGLGDGSRVSKSDCNIALYGNIDELNSWIGLIKSELNNKDELLLNIQSDLFVLGTFLASKNIDNDSIFNVLNSSTEILEKTIDELSNSLPILKNFILPGGSVTTSHIHIARTVCRKAEREVVSYFTEENLLSHQNAISVIKYLNRLSDYLFILARYNCIILERNEEIIWKPNES